VAAKTVRLPLTASYNTRVSTTNPALGAAAIAGIAIAGVAIAGSGATSSTKDSRLINCFNETVSDPITGAKTIYCVKRPGFGTANTPAAGSIGNAITVWTGSGSGTDVVTAFGASNSTVYIGTTSEGTITGRARTIVETEVGVTVPTLLIASTDSTGWYYDAGVGTMTKITDVDFPGNAGYITVGGFVAMDSFAFIMTTDGKIWASDLNSGTAWTATSFASANSYPDKGIGLIRYKQYVMAMGQKSLQFFYNAGQTPFPLQCSTTMTVKVGCVSADAMTSISDVVFWVGSTPEGGLSLFRYDGGVQKVSTAEIDSLMLIAGASQISLTSIRFYGRSFVLCIVGSRTLVYCIEEQAWHEWVSGTAVLWYKCAAVSIGSTMVNYAISNISTSGKVYVMNQALLAYTDDGFTYSANPQLALLDFGSKKRKFWDSLEIVGDRETSASPFSISYSDDDYQTFQTWGTVDLSDARPIARRLGSSRRRAWSFSHSADTPMRIEAAEIGARLGTS
jgi:hypothetical protein